MAPKKKVKAAKVKKKKWVSVLAPKAFNNAVLGETHVAEDEEVLRKSITLNLSTVMGDMRKQGYLIRFDVTKLHEGKAQTAAVGLTMTPSGVKRLIRRGRSKVEDSFLAKLKDGRIIRIKPIIVTTNRCSKPAKTSIRLAVREKLKELLGKTTFDAFVDEVIALKVQRTLKDIANKSHPTRSADIKAIQLLPKHKEGLAEQTETPAEAPEKASETTKKEIKPEESKPEEATEEPAEESTSEEAKDPEKPE